MRATCSDYAILTDLTILTITVQELRLPSVTTPLQLFFWKEKKNSIIYGS
jgi:hypothetical protein